MKRMTAGTRITLGLVCSMVGILMMAHYLGLLPDREQIDISHRKQTSETLALSAVAMLAQDDQRGLEAVLNGLVKRRADLESVAVISAVDGIVIEAGEHEAHWPGDLGNRSNDRYMQVPLAKPDNPEWGRIEFRYAPLLKEGIFSSLQTQFYSLLLFCAVLAFFAFRTFLRFVMKNLDPSRAVPRRVREALDILAEGLMIVGIDGRILLANNSLAELTGNSADAMTGKKASSLGFRLVDGSEELPWERALAQGSSLANSSMLLNDDSADGQILNVNCSPLLGNQGEYRGVMVTFDDVTQLERNKAELKSAKEDAEAANQAKSDFLANMSHEIRNPMNAIVGFTDILRRGLEDGPETRSDYLNTIYSSGTHLVGLINDILDLSKIEAGRMELEICECSPWQVLSEVVAVMKGKAQEDGLELRCEMRGRIPATIQSDPTRLRQILMNLVSNAIKFTHDGSVRIVAELRKSDAKSHLHFECIDTGIGMTPEQSARIFEEFVQADSSVTRRFGGTGLGLAISKRLTEAMGGQIKVTSEVDKGSTFSFSVDTGDLAGVELMDIDQASESVSKGNQQQVGLKIAFEPARVLVTDDTPENRKLVGLVLRKAGLTVDEAENGLQAVEMVGTNDYDLVLMDMQMPVMDGFTAVSTLREQGETLPVIALTANVMQSDRERCHASGCTGFLTKPIDIDQLLRTLSDYLPTTDISGQDPTSKSAGDAIERAPQGVEEPADSKPTDAKINSENDLAVSDTKTNQRVLISTLPTEIPEFREIVEQFVDGLEPMIEELQLAWKDRNYDELQSLAHRLKGTGGTVGFADFTAPAERLQHQAESKCEDEIEELLVELSELSAAVMRPETPATQLGL